MPKFICKNSECLFYNKEVVEAKVTYKQINDKLVAIERFCPYCNSEREEIIENFKLEPPTYEATGLKSNRRTFYKKTKNNYY